MPETKRDLNWWIDISKLSLSNPHLIYKRLEYNSKRFISAYASKFGYYTYPNNIIFLAGMPGSATTWMKNLLVRVPGYYTRPMPMPFDVSYNQNICDSAFSRTPIDSHTLIKTHLNPTKENLECIRRNNVKKIVVSYRDLRDIAVFRYHRLVEFPKNKKDHDFVDYNNMSKKDALDHSISIVNDNYIPWILGWKKFAEQEPDLFHFYKFEDLKKDTFSEFKKVLQFFEIELPDDKVIKIIEAAKGKRDVKQNMKRRKLLPWGLASNFRSGKIGNWQSELTEDQIKRTEILFADVLDELGYY